MEIFSSFIPLFLVLFSITLCLCMYALLRRIREKRNSRPLWLPEHEDDLKAALNRIYAATCVDILKSTVAEEIRCYPRYHNIFTAATDERYATIAQENASNSSFEIREAKARKMWLIAFSGNWLLSWIFFMLPICVIGFQAKSYQASFTLVFCFTALIGAAVWTTLHCAYLKKGTRLLTWLLIVSPLQMLISLQKELLDPSAWYLIPIDIGVFAFYWICCFRLHKVNQEAKTIKKLTRFKELLA